MTKFKNLRLQNYFANFDQILHKTYLGEGDSLFVQIKKHSILK